MGVFDRLRYAVTSSYIPETGWLGLRSMPHFVVQFENEGTVPVTFSDFELLLPEVLTPDEDGQLVGTMGAELYIDKNRASRIVALQHIEKIDYRTTKVELRGRSSHMEFFDLRTFLPEGWGELGKLDKNYGTLADFEPVLAFHDNYGNEFHCDRRGIHRGAYEHPQMEALKTEGYDPGTPSKIVVKRRRVGTRRLRTRWEYDEPSDDPPTKEREADRVANRGDV
jgi:hypothetical protein